MIIGVQTKRGQRVDRILGNLEIQKERFQLSCSHSPLEKKNINNLLSLVLLSICYFSFLHMALCWSISYSKKQYFKKSKEKNNYRSFEKLRILQFSWYDSWFLKVTHEYPNKFSKRKGKNPSSFKFSNISLKSKVGQKFDFSGII